MKVLHISTLSKGGAFNAAFRLHQGLLMIGVKSVFLTLDSKDNEEVIRFPVFGKYGLSFKKRILNKLKIRELKSVERKRDFEQLKYPIEAFSSPKADYSVARYIKEKIKPDIVNLHWVAGFVDYEEFFSEITVPVVWTLHDQQPFAGFWHYSMDSLDQSEATDINSEYLKTKLRAINKCHHSIEIVAPSKWLLNESKESPLFKTLPHHLVRYGIDTNIFKPTYEPPKSIHKKHVNTKKIKLLFICQSLENRRKGMLLLIDALKQIPNANFLLIAVGDSQNSLLQDLDAEIIFTGNISQQRELARLYSFVDAMVIPSIQDNLPNTLLESLCCGTPVLGTAVGGIKEILSNSNLGLISKSIDSKGLGEILNSFTNHSFDRERISTIAKRKFYLEKQAEEYFSIYKHLIRESISQ